MRNISPSLEYKIKQTQQTIYQGREPGLLVLATPPSNYVSTGGVWHPNVTIPLSDYFVSAEHASAGSTPVRGLSLTIKNPDNIFVGEDTDFPPETKIESKLYFGDTADVFDMGIYYVDKSDFEVYAETVGLSGRNNSGRYLYDQTFDEVTVWEGTLSEVLTGILTYSGIPSFQVGESAVPIEMNFTPEQSLLAGIMETLKHDTSFRIYELYNGTVVIGNSGHEFMPAPADYEFYRDTDCWSRKKSNDTIMSFARVGVQYLSNKYVYADIPGATALGKKTYYTRIAGLESGAIAYANALAEWMKDGGVLEEFIGPIRPHIQEGDRAVIIDTPGGGYRGDITSIKHTCSDTGFYTEFVVDTAGFWNKPNILDYIQLAKEKKDKDKGEIWVEPSSPWGTPPPSSMPMSDPEGEPIWEGKGEFIDDVIDKAYDDITGEILTDAEFQEALADALTESIVDNIAEEALPGEIWGIGPEGSPEWIPGSDFLGTPVEVNITSESPLKWSVDWKEHTPFAVFVFENDKLKEAYTGETVTAEMEWPES